MFDGGEDRSAVFDDASLQFHERGDPGPSGPPHPLVEGLGGLVVRQFEDLTCSGDFGQWALLG